MILRKVAGQNILLIILCIVLLLPRSAVSEEVIFSLSGSNTVGAKLAPALVIGYLKSVGAEAINIEPSATNNNESVIRARLLSDNGLYQLISVHLAAHGSSTGFKALNSEVADIAMSSRQIKPKEVKRLQRFGDLKAIGAEHIIAIDGLAIIVHRDNKLQTLSKTLLAKIFSGEINNWQQLGGADTAINRYARDDQSGTWDTFKKLVLGKVPLDKSAERFESNAELSRRVSTDLYGIGFVPLAAVGQAKVLSVSDDQTRAMRPQQINVATEDYPLARRLYLYTRPDVDNPHILHFIDYVMARQGQTVVEDIGFISQNIIAVKQPIVRGAPDNYNELIRRAQRLSVNFYFSPGSSKLDTKAYRDLLRLEHYFAREQSGDEVWLVGFSDQKSSPALESLLARHRALKVKNKLHGKVENIQPVMSVGAFMPIANNADDAAKMKNGRVEVWLSSAQ
ncbi:hypothetical protein SIN8267_01457 [Sinobacterium norvegicum]|uniref:OmpA-like domain-containing protein n=1 Tax=Sinobacterium norvegicum TaxID=1641715 RepID=A0ABN8EH88_9GAMM|nr:substrate-binding domain-containing protein [Sinobacterium norvegicum]CAH0991354.1 hypothetical protein SIN8267_01457 [Sinobacterium norvegicum]